MSRKTERPRPGGRLSDPTARWGEFYSLIRQCHVFTSCTRDLLEAGLVADVAPEPLSEAQFHLLRLVALNGSHQVREAAEFLGVSGPAATKNVDKLERLGLVERTTPAADRRTRLLACTPRGLEVVERYEALKERRLAPVLARFSPEELHALGSLLQRFSTALVEEHSEASGLCLRCGAYYEAQCPVDKVRAECTYRRVRVDVEDDSGEPAGGARRRSGA